MVCLGSVPDSFLPADTVMLLLALFLKISSGFFTESFHEIFNDNFQRENFFQRNFQRSVKTSLFFCQFLLEFDAYELMDDIAMKASTREMIFHKISEKLKFSMKIFKKFQFR